VSRVSGALLRRTDMPVACQVVQRENAASMMARLGVFQRMTLQPRSASLLSFFISAGDGLPFME